MAFGVICRINPYSKRFLTVQQCMRYTLARNRKICCGGFNSLTKVSLVKCKPNSLQCQTVSKVHLETHFFSKRHQYVGYLGCRSFSNELNKSKDEGSGGEGKPEKKQYYQKFKKLYKEYWYVLVPVHLITSVLWLGSFYYLSVSGIDIPALLESIGISKDWVEILKNSKTGHMVFAYTLFKIASPLRYTVTLGGTTISINYLKKWGWIKPVPNKEQIKKIYEKQAGALKDLKASYQDKMQVTKNEFLKTKKEMKQHYIEAKEELHKSVKETKDDFKEGVKSATDEWKLIGRLSLKSAKETWNSYAGKK